MGRLYRPGPKSCVVRCREQCERKDQLDIVMRVKAGARCSADRRGGKQPEERCSFWRPPSPNLTLIPARHYRPDNQRQTGPDERQREQDSFLPKHVRNVMIGNCPVERLMEDALLPKYNRHETEGCEKSYREYGCLNDRIRSRQTSAGSIAREE